VRAAHAEPEEDESMAVPVAVLAVRELLVARSSSSLGMEGEPEVWEPYILVGSEWMASFSASSCAFTACLPRCSRCCIATPFVHAISRRVSSSPPKRHPMKATIELTASKALRSDGGDMGGDGPSGRGGGAGGGGDSGGDGGDGGGDGGDGGGGGSARNGGAGGCTLGGSGGDGGRNGGRGIAGGRMQKTRR